MKFPCNPRQLFFYCCVFYVGFFSRSFFSSNSTSSSTETTPYAQSSIFSSILAPFISQSSPSPPQSSHSKKSRLQVQQKSQFASPDEEADDGDETSPSDPDEEIDAAIQLILTDIKLEDEAKSTHKKPHVRHKPPSCPLCPKCYPTPCPPCMACVEKQCPALPTPTPCPERPPCPSPSSVLPVSLLPVPPSSSSPPSSSTSRPSANFIFGIALGYDAEIIYRFTSTARRACPSCEIRLFVAEKEAAMADVQTALSLTNTKILLVKGAIGGEGPEVDKSAARYYLMKGYLREYEEMITQDKSNQLPNMSQILCIDVRDTIFQRDPFALTVPFFINANHTIARTLKGPSWLSYANDAIPIGKIEQQAVADIVGSHMNLAVAPWIIAFAEPTSTRIAHCGINTAWIRDGLPDRNPAPFLSNVILCSGGLMGNLQGMKIYYDRFVQETEKLRAETRLYHGVDQGIHMALIYRHQFEPAAVFVSCNEAGPFMNTLNYQRKIIRDAFGFLMNSENPSEMVAVVHQIDRNTAIWKQWEPKFKVLPEGERTLQG